MSEKSVIDNIQKSQSIFSPTERKVAEYVLRYPNQVTEYTVKELSIASGVSEATVVRMCQHAGYTGYWPFRTMLARDMGMMERTRNIEQDKENIADDIFQKYSSIIQNISNNLDTTTLSESARLIDNCNEIHVIAAGDTGTLARHMGFCLGRIGIRATYSGLADYYLNTINLADKNDVVCAISKSGVTKAVIQGAELAREKGLKVIAITEYNNSRLAELADYVLLSKGDSLRFDYYKNYNHLSETVVIEALLELVKNVDKIVEKKADQLEFMLSEAKL
ncbi:RpiR family transcriptional regulator [Muricomes intestini]|jgi:DNA-binding MurR/RpiR family transcriptional regulator|uniref:RpiR family transcriptional regulator n=1 Tax=Muricomes intestini TaxID=1796634 RepID=A0A4R3K3B3_9FIRM|nr:MurR/RpiR family transcriptional regulator [Muricomes intestini]TCS77179.1 RpiR family transcriptional regulator [Muricomes intestini]HAX51695.1 MurR/RpiR family transcriptional regulator [Lachnospiraceae bacterium]